MEEGEEEEEVEEVIIKYLIRNNYQYIFIYSKYLKILIPLLCLLVIACTVIYSKSIKTDISLNGEEKIVLEYGENYDDPGATGHFATLFSKNQEAKVEVNGKVDEKKLGTYSIEYKVSKFFHSSIVKRTVEIVDTVAPDIKLNMSSDYYCKIGEDYEEEGYIATDNYDGDITKDVINFNHLFFPKR